MSLGAILTGFAVAMIALTYITRPFRRAANNPDAVIETWINQSGRPVSRPSPSLPHSLTPDTQTNFCPQCGRKVAPDHRFCPGCGYRLPREEPEA